MGPSEGAPGRARRDRPVIKAGGGPHSTEVIVLKGDIVVPVDWGMVSVARDAIAWWRAQEPSAVSWAVLNVRSPSGDMLAIEFADVVGFGIPKGATPAPPQQPVFRGPPGLLDHEMRRWQCPNPRREPRRRDGKPETLLEVAEASISEEEPARDEEPPEQRTTYTAPRTLPEHVRPPSRAAMNAHIVGAYGASQGFVCGVMAAWKDRLYPQLDPRRRREAPAYCLCKRPVLDRVYLGRPACRACGRISPLRVRAMA